MFEKINDKAVNKGLHWTTIASEKVLLSVIGISTCIAAAMYCYEMFLARQITLSDLFMLFIYAEILGMVELFIRLQEYLLPCQLSLQLLLYAD